MDSAYTVETDPVLQALIAEAVADSDVLGLVLTGSRTVGTVTPESDYDVIFVVTDEALARAAQAHTLPQRGTTIMPPISTADIWDTAPSALHLEHVKPWMLPAYAEARVLYDRTGETTRLIAALRRMPAAQAEAAVAAGYDAYLNGVYRSLKAWRRGDAPERGWKRRRPLIPCCTCCLPWSTTGVRTIAA